MIYRKMPLNKKFYKLFQHNPYISRLNCAFRAVAKSASYALKVSFVYAVLFGGAAQAQDRSKEIDVIYSKLVSALPTEGVLMLSPYADSLQIFGDDIKASYNKESDAMGGVALEIETKRGKNPWDAGVFNVAGAEIKKGDVIYMAFFAKALELPKGKESALIKNVGVQKGTEPYTTVIGKDFSLSQQWQSFALAGVANDSYKANEAQLSMQIATAKQKIAIGPVFVFNLGSDVDPSTLPFISQ
ncbi:hypothetical protein ISG33_01700 [Glaciecola sp. MH2013]|uniref:hypothetical protein n=1 Tax=Glaciecola sp. MH2013 TaxID=2785524 RepID=UPI0018A101BD|nr:hypothetical protein [Glaciecola sp. MH2013]MBF7072114.1 hypothetical protein [Glaciecola sp. MH2013]